MFEFSGRHILGEMYGVEQNLLDDEEAFYKIVTEALEQAQFQCVGVQSKKFSPNGLTMVFLLAESHVAIHTYPEKGALFFDIFTCGPKDSTVVAQMMIDGLQPQNYNVRTILRPQNREERWKMVTRSTIEKYMLDMNLEFEQIGEDLWRANDIIISWSEEIIVFRVKVMTVPEHNQEALFKQLLELNAYDILHGAYALEGNNVVLVDTLQTENLNFNEFQASFESIELTLSGHVAILKHFQ